MSIVVAVVLVTALMIALGLCLDAFVGRVVRNDGTALVAQQRVRHRHPHMPFATRLRIIDLFGWTLWCAVVIACRKTWTEWDAIAPEWHLYFEVVHFMVAMGYGAALHAVTLLGWRWFHARAPILKHPGHSLLLIVAAAAMIDGTATVLLLAPWAQLDGWLVQGSACLLVAVVGAAVAYRMSQGSGWALVVLLAVAQSAILAALHFAVWEMRLDWVVFRRLYSITLGGGAVVAVLLVGIVALRDRRRTPGRDWMHWVGVSAYASLALLLLIVCTCGLV